MGKGYEKEMRVAFKHINRYSNLYGMKKTIKFTLKYNIILSYLPTTV